MAFGAKCPHCSKQIEFPDSEDDYFGEIITCPHCNGESMFGISLNGDQTLIAMVPPKETKMGK